jgi:hypothetical protein
VTTTVFAALAYLSCVIFQPLVPNWAVYTWPQTPGESDLTMYGPYGSMMENWGQMWQWMWMMQLVWVLPLLITVALVAVILRTRVGGPKTPATPTTASTLRE